MRLPHLLAALLTALVLALAACGGDDDADGGGDSTSTTETETQTRTDEASSEPGFGVDTPDGWKDETDRADELGFAGFKPAIVLVGKVEDGFRPSINVVRETSLSDDVSLEDYVEAGRGVLEKGSVGGQNIPGSEVELEDVEEAELGGDEAATFDHTREIQGRKLRARQVIALRDGTAFTLTFTALADRFDDDVDALDTVIDSWEWE